MIGYSGDKFIQLCGVLAAAYSFYIGRIINDYILMFIGVFMFFYDGYLLLFEKVEYDKTNGYIIHTNF